MRMNNNKKQNLLIFALVIIIVLLSCLLIYILVTNKKGSDSKNNNSSSIIKEESTYFVENKELINKEQYNLVRKEDGKKVTITSTDPSVSIKDGVIATVTVKNVRPEQANTSLSIKEIKFDDKTGTDVTRDFVLKYTTTTTTRAKNTSSKLSAITFKYGNIVEMTPTFKSNVFEYKICKLRSFTKP